MHKSSDGEVGESDCGREGLINALFNCVIQVILVSIISCFDKTSSR
jgi:hypothetical protein